MVKRLADVVCIDKCKVMHLGYNNCHADYFMDKVQLQKFMKREIWKL